MNKQCPICSNSISEQFSWKQEKIQIYRCSFCGVEFRGGKDQRKAKCQQDHFSSIDKDMYEQSVRYEREVSANRIVMELKNIVQEGRWLDVGCSYGFLLKSLKNTHFIGYGVEPSHSAVLEAQKDGLNVIEGCFPDVVGSKPPYRVISFLDVLEHLDSPEFILNKVNGITESNGFVVIQVPDQDCILYKLARAIAKFSLGKMDFALRRLWLLDFDFPHLFYFNKKSIVSLLNKTGYEIIKITREPLVQQSSAYNRVGYEQKMAGIKLHIVALGTKIVTLLDKTFSHGGLLLIIAKKKS